MTLNELTAISPIDGRYRSKTKQLACYFSEYALIRYRVKVEIEYFIALCQIPLPQLKGIGQDSFLVLRSIYEDFNEEDAKRVKDIEKTTNHDVKAVEYFIKEKLDNLGGTPDSCKEFIHFGLTSQDINNTAVPLSLKDALQQVVIPEMETLLNTLQTKADEWKEIPMLARTHGQPASPTRLGKEMEVFIYRLREQLDILSQCKISAKFGGATGNFNAHHAAFPEIDWKAFANSFVSNNLGLVREQWTTQISNYDHLASIFDALRRIAVILIDFCRDMWMYVSLEYFKQQIKANEVGSSAMPHKVNPIDFENAEGNLGLATGALTFLSQKLPISRLQRDLTDSTVIRNVGMPIAYMLIAMKSIEKGFGKLLLNKDAIDRDLDNNWAVCAEAIQTILRREGYPHPYEALKALTRTNKIITHETLSHFIENLKVDEEIKQELSAITPHTYTGI